MGQFTKNLNKRVLNRGNKNGYCVICGTLGKLTKDHVPPKSCNNLNDVELTALHSSIETTQVATTSQGGTHYKTLCERCNRELLGCEYDPYLAQLSNEITSLVLGAKNRLITLPRKIHPFVKPQRLARSIVGHCLAAIAIEETKSGLVSGSMNDALRSYFLDQSESFPEKLNIYFWPYPSRKQVVIKSMGKASIHNPRAHIIGHVLKFLPLGFWLVWDKPDSIRMNLMELVSNKSMKIDESHQIELDLYNIPALDFPEKPADDEYMLLNSDHAVVAKQKNKI